MKLDSHSPIPLHAQLMDQLRDEILSGELTDKIPSERELMERFMVSRSTVRQAISMLVLEGVLEKKHGKGTYIYHRPVEEWLGNLSIYNDVITDMGMTPGTKLLNTKIVDTKKIVHHFKRFGLSNQEKVYAIERLRLANGIPTAIEKQYYPLDIGTKLLEYDLNQEALYDLLELNIGISLWEAEQIITSKTATKEEANYLQIPRNTSVLVIERSTFDKDGNQIEYLQGTFRSDMYKFKIKLSRTQKPV